MTFSRFLEKLKTYEISSQLNHAALFLSKSAKFEIISIQNSSTTNSLSYSEFQLAQCPILICFGFLIYLPCLKMEIIRDSKYPYVSFISIYFKSATKEEMVSGYIFTFSQSVQNDKMTFISI